MSKRNVPKGMSKGTGKRVPQITALLNQALTLISNADPKSLPDDVQTAIGLVSSAATHARHIMVHEGLKPTDALSDNDAKGRARRGGYDALTAQVVDTDQVNDDNADDFAVCEACGYINPMDADACEQCGDPLGNPTGRAAKTAAIQRNSKPEETTSKKTLTDDALRLAYAKAVSREIDLGILYQ